MDTVSRAEVKMSLSIPRPLYHQIEKRAREADFSSVEEYALFVLQELAQDGEENERDQEPTSSPLSKEEEKKIEARLRGLGYID